MLRIGSARVLKWLLGKSGPRWELRFIQGGTTRYVMRCNSVIKMVGYVLPAFEQGVLRPGWTIECLSTSRERTAGLIQPSCFRPTVEGNNLTLAPQFIELIASIDPGYQVRGDIPEFFATGSAGMMPIPLRSAMTSHLNRGDIVSARSAEKGKSSKVTFYSIMKTVFEATNKSDVEAKGARNDDSAESDGCSPETAFVIPAIGPAEAVATEFRILNAMFGREDMDWKLHDRGMVKSATPRKVEKIIIGYKGKRHEVFFDISATGLAPDVPAVQNVLEDVFKRQRARSLFVEFPRPSLLALYQLISNLPQDAVPSDRMDRKHVEKKIMAACAQSGLMQDEDWASNPNTIRVELSILEWVTIVSLLRMLSNSAQTMPDSERSFLQEELMEDSRARIEGAVKQEGAG